MERDVLSLFIVCVVAFLSRKGCDLCYFSGVATRKHMSLGSPVDASKKL